MPTRREAAMGLGLAAALPGALAAAPSKRPNIILVVADDMAWGDLRCHGNARVDTPVLDALAAESVAFDRFLVGTACAPTRAALLTGRHHLRTGANGGVSHQLETVRSSETTIAELLAAHGYATAMVGKWHNGAHFPYTPTGQGFGDFFGYTANALTRHFDATLLDGTTEVRTRGFVTDVLTDRAIAWLERPHARPFFLYLAHAAPHAPMQAPDALFDKYRARGFAAYEAAVHAMVENLDNNLGRLLARLEALGLADDTIVAFTSDNGPQHARFNGGMKGLKGEVDEGGVRVPLFIRYPALAGRAGRRVGGVAAHVDLFPTFAALAGVAPPRSLALDGVSLGGALAGAPPPRGRLIFTHALASETADRDGRPPLFLGAVRDERWRAVNKGGGWELYDMGRDPGQTDNVAARESATVARVDRAYRAWFADVTRRGFRRPPIPVGYRQAPQVELPVVEATLTGGVRWVRPAGLNGDWLVNWRSTGDRIAWDVEVVRAGAYRVSLDYACPATEAGSRIEVRAGAARLEGLVAAAPGRALPGPDRVPRVVPERDWGRLELGVLHLPKGRSFVDLRALAIPAAQVADLLALHLDATDASPRKDRT